MPLAADCLMPFDKERTTTAIRPVTRAALDDLLADLSPCATSWVKGQGFKGDAGALLCVPDESGATEIVLLGMGDNEPDISDPWFIAPAAVGLPEGLYHLDWAPDARRIHEGALMVWALAHYRFDRYKAVNSVPPTLMAPEDIRLSDVLHRAEAAALTRDLINTPAEDLGPAELEVAAHDLADRFGGEVRTITGDDLLTDNFPAIHAVGRAAAPGREPRLISLTWSNKDSGPDTPHVILVGKGVCFDSGGLNIKPGSGMRLMKKDMGGAAHALGLAYLIMSEGLNARLTVLIAAVENAISGGAFRPGDILETRQGLSVEVGNTDAEGRLILSDALTFASEQQPDLLVDFATLTGAARVALGAELPATFVNEDALWTTLASAGASAADPLWRMPLWPGYRENLASPIADLSNISDGPLAGSITAALFLEYFVGDDIPWVHFDLFGWNPKAKPGRPVGAAAQTIFATFGALKQRFSL